MLVRLVKIGGVVKFLATSITWAWTSEPTRFTSHRVPCEHLLHIFADRRVLVRIARRESSSDELPLGRHFAAEMVTASVCRIHRAVEYVMLRSRLDVIITRVLLVLKRDARDVGWDGFKTAALRVNFLVEAELSVDIGREVDLMTDNLVLHLCVLLLPAVNSAQLLSNCFKGWVEDYFYFRILLIEAFESFEVTPRQNRIKLCLCLR